MMKQRKEFVHPDSERKDCDSLVDQELFGSVWDNIGEKDAGEESSEHPHDPMVEYYTSE